MSIVSGSFRSRFRASIEQPVGKLFARTGLSPNALTLIGFGIACVGAALASVQSWLIAAVIVAFGAVFDLFDGAVARATGKTSRLGAFLDSTMDRAGEAVVYVGIAAGCVAAGFGPGVLLASGAMAGAFMVSYTRAKSESLGFGSGTGLANVGVAPREVRSIILVVGLIAVGLAGPIGTISCSGGSLTSCVTMTDYSKGDLVLGGTLALIAVLATVTTIQRMFFVYRQSKSSN